MRADSWRINWYPLDPREAISGWVGLSEIVSVGEDRFWVLERDNQGGPFARIKRIYEIDLAAPRDEYTDESAANGRGQTFQVLRKNPRCTTCCRTTRP